jgi:hypothetical protein
MQQVQVGYRLLGNPAVSGPANVTEISLGTGLGFDAGQLKNTAIPTVSASGTNTFTGANTFQGNVTVGDAAADALTVNATMSTVAPVTLGATSSTNQITINGPLKITSGTPVAGQVLTCDGSGNATWEQSAANPYTPSLTGIGSVQFMGWQTNVTAPDSQWCFPTSDLLVSVGGGSNPQLRIKAGYGGTWKMRAVGATSSYIYTLTESAGPPRGSSTANGTNYSPTAHYTLVRVS